MDKKDKDKDKKDKDKYKDKSKDKVKDKVKDKEKDKEKEKEKKLKLHKRSLKKWLIKSKDNQIFDTIHAKDISNDTKNGALSPNIMSSKRASVSVANLSIMDSDDEDEDQDDIDDDKIDAMIKTEESQPLTTKDVTNMILDRLKNHLLEPITFTPLTEALEAAQEDQNHIIFIVYCVDWFNLAKQTYENFKSISKDKDIKVFFVNQSGNDYIKENYYDIAGIPTIKIYYKQIPIKMKRNDLEYDWNDDERLKGFISPTNIQELVKECKECKNNYDSQYLSESVLPLNLEISLDF